MEKIVFTNKSINKTIEFTDGLGNFILKNISGTGSLQANNYLVKTPNQDGKSFRGSDMEERLISLEVAIVSEDEEQLHKLKRKISKIINPKAGVCELKYVYPGGENLIDVIIETAPSFDSKETDTRILNSIIHLIGPDPFWKSVYTNSEIITTWVGGLSFPISFPNSFATKGSPDVLIENNGDVETPVIIKFRGPATNPIITNDSTEEFIKVNKSLTVDQILHVSTHFGNKYVEIEDLTTGDRTNVFNWIDLNSNFFKLKVGQNIIVCNSDEGAEEATITVEWKERYTGV